MTKTPSEEHKGSRSHGRAAYSVIHNADPEKYQWGEILEILPPAPRITEDAIRRNIQLHYEIYQKKSNWRPG